MTPAAPIIPIMIMCSHGIIPIMRGLVAKSFYFDGEPMSTVICYTLSQDSPFEDDLHIVESKENGVAKCSPGYAIKSLMLFTEEDKTLNKFQLVCQKIKSAYLVPGETSMVQNYDKNLDCQGENVMTGLETKRDGDEYIVTAHCQTLKASRPGGPRAPFG